MRLMRLSLIAFATLGSGMLAPARAQMDSSFLLQKQKAVDNLKNFPNQDTNRVNALIDVFTVGSYLRERQEVMPYRLEAEALSRRLQYTKGLAFTYSAAANYYKSASRYDDALASFDTVLAITANNQHPDLVELRAIVHQRMGAIHYERSSYYKALDHFFESLKYPHHSITRIIRLNIAITDIYVALNNLESATLFARKNIQLAEADSSSGMRSSIYLSFIEICLAKRDFNTAFEYLDKIAPEVPYANEAQLNYGYYIKRGEASYLRQKYSDAYMFFRQAYKYALEGGHKKSINYALRFLSNTALKLGDAAAARDYAMKNLELAEEINTPMEKIAAISNLAEYYQSMGDKNRALDLMRQALQLKDSLLSETNIKQMNILAAIYEAEKQEKEINRLQQEKDLQAADARHKSVLNWVFIGSIALLLVLGYLGYINFRRGQQLAQHQQTIQRQKILQLEKDKQLLTVDAMLKGQEEERSRIAKDLHDGLGSLLSGAKLSFMNIRESLSLTPNQAMLFDKSLCMLDNTIGDLRKVAHNISPEGLVKFGLCETIRDFCESIQSSTGLNIRFQHYGENRRLDNTAEVFIYRMIQELVNNIIRHAEATDILVQLVMMPEKIVVTVEDNGKGFDQASLTATKGTGMNNIRHRMQYFNGTLDIDTAPGKGTSVNIELIV